VDWNLAHISSRWTLGMTRRAVRHGEERSLVVRGRPPFRRRPTSCRVVRGMIHPVSYVALLLLTAVEGAHPSLRLHERAVAAADAEPQSLDLRVGSTPQQSPAVGSLDEGPCFPVSCLTHHHRFSSRSEGGKPHTTHLGWPALDQPPTPVSCVCVPLFSRYWLYVPSASLTPVLAYSVLSLLFVHPLHRSLPFHPPSPHPTLILTPDQPIHLADTIYRLHGPCLLFPCVCLSVCEWVGVLGRGVVVLHEFWIPKRG